MAKKQMQNKHYFVERILGSNQFHVRYKTPRKAMVDQIMGERYTRQLLIDFNRRGYIADAIIF